MSQSKFVAKVLLCFLSLAVVLAAADVQALSETQNSIVGLNISDAGNGKLLLKIDFTQPLANPPAGFSVSSPPRIAFDFVNTGNGLGKNVLDFGEGKVRSANIVQAGSRTRLVLNLNQMLVYDARTENNSLLINMYGKAAASAAEGGVLRFAEAKRDSPQQHALRDIDFRRGKNGEGRIQIDLSDTTTGIDIRQQGTKLIVDFNKTSLPKNLQRKLDVADFNTPVQGMDTFVQGENVQMIIEPKGLWEYAAYQTDNKFIVEIKSVLPDQSRVGAGRRGYKGDHLSLDFQDISVREALNVIADFTGDNIVISDTVKGNLTLRLKDVPSDQALEIILQSRGLDMRQSGNVTRVAPRDELAAQEKLDLGAKQEIAELEEVRTESFQLSYQTAEELAAMLTNPTQHILSKRGSAVVDKRTNTVFVQDTSSHLEEARRLIKQIDVPVRQVMIEARVVEATDKFGKNLGAKLGYKSTDSISIGNSTRVFGNIGANTPNVGPLAGVTMPANTPNVNLPTTMGTGPAGTFSMLLFNSSISKILSIELEALETDSKGKIISSPRVVTADKAEALIEAGTEIPYLQSSSSGAANIAFKKAVLSLNVRPQITPDDNVILNVKVNKDSVGTLFNGVPSIDTNKVNTQVLVENGGTVVIGGVYSQILKDTVDKVPFFGDIPVLGFLFRRTLNQDDKSELLVFITPKILKDAENMH